MGVGIAQGRYTSWTEHAQTLIIPQDPHAVCREGQGGWHWEIKYDGNESDGDEFGNSTDSDKRSKGTDVNLNDLESDALKEDELADGEVLECPLPHHDAAPAAEDVEVVEVGGVLEAAPSSPTLIDKHLGAVDGDAFWVADIFPQNEDNHLARRRTNPNEA